MTATSFYTIRRVPWTCEWGRLGVAVEDLAPATRAWTTCSGLKKENVKIEVTHDELTIEGERTLEKEEPVEGLYRTERTYGTFDRRIAIPEYVKAEDAVAIFKDGVLQIEMPTIPVPEVKKRTVEIIG
jgi:HSP20 family molecular chaperone IbpA